MDANRPDRPAHFALIVTLCKGDENGKGDYPTWIARAQTPRHNRKTPKAVYKGKVLSLWNTKVAADESPLQAAVRCANYQFWKFRQSHGLRTGDFKLEHQIETPNTVLNVFYLTWLLHPKLLKSSESVEFVPVGFHQNYTLTHQTVLALNHLPPRQLANLSQLTQEHVLGMMQ